MKKQTKYIVKYRVSGTNERYIRRRYEKNYDYRESPMLTPKVHLIDNDCMKDTYEGAEDMIDELVADAKVNIKRMKREGYAQNSRSWQYTWYKKEEHRSQRDRYSVEEYVPDFICNTKRKSVKEVWKKDGSAKTFCTCCGSNIHYGDYALIRQAKICPFCLKRMGEQAKGVIRELKKKDRNIEDDYNCSVFIAHMD